MLLWKCPGLLCHKGERMKFYKSSLLLTITFLITSFSYKTYANDPDMEGTVRGRMQERSEELQRQNRIRTASGRLRVQDAEAEDLVRVKDEARGYLRRRIAHELVAMYGNEAAPIDLELSGTFRTVVGEFLKAVLFQLANERGNSGKDGLILEALLRYPEILKEIDTAQKISAAFERGDLTLPAPKAEEWQALAGEESRRGLSQDFDTEFLPDIVRQFRDRRAFPLSTSSASVFSFYTGYQGEVQKSFPLGADLLLSFMVTLNTAGITEIKQSEIDVIDGVLTLCMTMKGSGALDDAQSIAQFRKKFDAFWAAVTEYYTLVKDGVSILDMEIKLAEIDRLGFEAFGSVMSDFGGTHGFSTSRTGMRIVENLPFASVLETLKQSKGVFVDVIRESGYKTIDQREITSITIRGYHAETGDLIITLSSLFYTGNFLIRGVMNQVQMGQSIQISPENIIVFNEPYSDVTGKYLERSALFQELSLDRFTLSEVSQKIVEHQIRTRGIKPVQTERSGMSQRIARAAGRQLRKFGIRATEVELSETDRTWVEKITERSIKGRRGRAIDLEAL